MCDLATIYTIISIADVAIIVAIVSCGVAIALNLGFITAGGAPIAFGIALASGLVAMLGFGPVAGMLAGCQSPPCASLATEALAYFALVTGALGTGIAIAYIAILTSAVPGVGIAPMVSYGVFLLVASGFLAAALDRMRTLQGCLTTPVPPEAAAANALGYIAVGVAVIAVLIVAALFGRSSGPGKPGG